MLTFTQLVFPTAVDSHVLFKLWPAHKFRLGGEARVNLSYLP